MTSPSGRSSGGAVYLLICLALAAWAPPSRAQNPVSGLGGKLSGGRPPPQSQPASMPDSPSTRPSPPNPAEPPATAPAALPPDQIVNAPRITARQNRTPLGLTGVGLTADQVNLAIDRGAAFLWNRIKTEDLGKKGQRLGDSPEQVLACLALVHAGATKKFPDFEIALREYLTRFKPESYWIVYQYGLTSMLIESYGDPSFFDKQRLLARYLVEAEGPGGTWNYVAGLSGQLKPEPDSQEPLRVLEGGIAASASTGEGGMSRQSDWSIGKDGDSSCSQFAVLGLHAASRCHLAIAREVWKRNLAAYRRRQGKAGGWGYTDGDAQFPYGSMTCAGLCALAIDRYELGEADFEVDEGIERGLAWLAAHFSVTTNPQHSAYYLYYLYSLERVGRTLDTEFIGDHEWYPLGAKALVDSQRPDGSWVEGPDADPRNPTSFALLFLTRATPSLRVELKHGGSGNVTTAVATPPPARLYVILDASGSMLDNMDGRQKFDIARDSVWAIFAGLPDSAEVALRVYGHRKRSIEKGSDEDTALEYPMAVIDRPKLKALLQRLRPRGKTPLALSLNQARQDLSSWSGQPVTVVLLTDGGEDTMPRRDPVKAASEFGSVPGLTFHIVGFDINQEDWGTQLRAMAAASGGNYWPAARGEVLAREVRSAVFGIPDQFTLFDSASHEIARGQFGQTRTVPEGQYQLDARYGGRDFHTAVWVHTEATTAVIFDAAHAMAVPSTPATAPTSAPAAAQHFCTHCGHLLPVGAKFCPTCGQPVSSN